MLLFLHRAARGGYRRAEAGFGELDPKRLQKNLVLLIQPHDVGMMLRGNFLGHLGKAHDRQAITGLAEMRRGAVQLDHATAGPAEDHVSLKALTVVDIADQDFLVGQEPGFFREFLIDGEAALVVEIRAGDRGAVKFGFKKRVSGHANNDYNTTLSLFDLPDTLDMPSALEGRVKKNLHTFECNVFRDHPLADGHDIRVVVAAAQFGRL